VSLETSALSRRHFAGGGAPVFATSGGGAPTDFDGGGGVTGKPAAAALLQANCC